MLDTLIDEFFPPNPSLERDRIYTVGAYHCMAHPSKGPLSDTIMIFTILDMAAFNNLRLREDFQGTLSARCLVSNREDISCSIQGIAYNYIISDLEEKYLLHHGFYIPMGNTEFLLESNTLPLKINLYLGEEYNYQITPDNRELYTYPIRDINDR